MRSQVSPTTAAVVCSWCGGQVARVDEHDRCEQCVMDASSLGCNALADLEEFVKDGLRRGLAPDLLREAFEMSLANTAGPLTGTLVTRRPVDTRERGIWDEPPSLFIDRSDDPPTRSAIADRRVFAGWSLELLADKLGVPVEEAALWEAGATPPRPHAQALSDMLGVSLDYLLGCHGRDGVLCARCGVEGPGNPDRYEQGWDVAGGIELRCPDCLTPGDLDW